MPIIEFEHIKFPPWAKKDTSFDVSMSELVAASIKAGDTTAIGGHRRSSYEQLWRSMAPTAFLEPKTVDGSEYWAYNDSYHNLDPSEKVSVSYHLGTALTCYLNKRILGLEEIAHVDAALRIIRTAPYGIRPDLVGYFPGAATPNPRGAGRVLIEAKGRSKFSPSEARREAAKALGQIDEYPSRKFPSRRNVAYKLVNARPLRVASVCYFTPERRWKAVLHDPPSDRTLPPNGISDNAFRGILNIASLNSVSAVIEGISTYAPNQTVTTEKRDTLPSMTFARFPDGDTVVGLPTEIRGEIINLEIYSGEGITPARAAQWSEAMPQRRQRTEAIRSEMAERYREVFEEPDTDPDGVVVAQIKPALRDRQSLEEVLNQELR